MSAIQLEQKLRRGQNQARLKAVFSICLGPVLCVAFVFFFFSAHDLIPRIGFGVISLWCLYFAYQAYKWVWPSPIAPDVAFTTTLHAYRRELEKRRDYAQHIWQRAGLTFCFLGLAMVILPGIIKSLETPRLLLNFAPILILCALWFVMFFGLRRRDQRLLKEEIEELTSFEAANQM